MFMLLGIPGLILAVLAFTTLREPRTASKSDSSQEPHISAAPSGMRVDPDEPGLKELWATLWSNRTFRHLLISYSLLSYFNYGILNWQPTFFERSFGLKTGELGTWFALIYGSSTMLGIYLGGEWASRHAANNERLQLRAMAIANAACNGVLWALVYLSRDYRLALILMGLSNLGSTTVFGPLFATFQTLIPARMRAMSIAIVYLFANFIGLGLGPLAVGAISDALQPVFGIESLRYALVVLCPGYLWASWHLWRAARTVERDLAAVRPGRQELAEEVRRIALDSFGSPL
jgi:hypothetical protein